MLGYNEHGNLGLGHHKPVAEPTLVQSLKSVNVTHVFAGGYNVFCMSMSDYDMIQLLTDSYNSDITVIR